MARKPGDPPGRPKGRPNKITRDVRAAIHEAFHLAGGVKYLVRLAEDDPRTFATLLARIIPAEVKLAVEGRLVVSLDGDGAGQVIEGERAEPPQLEPPPQWN